MPARNFVADVVSAAAPNVRPWNDPWKTTMPGRCVACRARRIAASTASLPLLTKNRESSPEGSTSPSRSVRSRSGRLSTVVYCPWMRRAACSCTAATTVGWQCPVEVTPMPAVKSR